MNQLHPDRDSKQDIERPDEDLRPHQKGQSPGRGRALAVSPTRRPPAYGGGEDRQEGVNHPEVGEEMRFAQVPQTSPILGEESVSQRRHCTGSCQQDERNPTRYHPSPHSRLRARGEAPPTRQPERGERQGCQEEQRVDQMKGNRDHPGKGRVVADPLGQDDCGPDQRFPHNRYDREECTASGRLAGRHLTPNQHGQGDDQQQGNTAGSTVGELDRRRPLQFGEQLSLTGRPGRAASSTRPGRSHQGAHQDHTYVENQGEPCEACNPGHGRKVRCWPAVRPRAGRAYPQPPMEIFDDVVAAIGNTPLVRLARIHPAGNLVAKLEHMNPGGSTKERIAASMIAAAERAGLLKPGGTIIEPTSGNTGVGLAMIGAVRGYRVICTVPDKVSQEKRDLLAAYGVEVIVTPTELLPEDPGSYYGVARRLAAEIDGAYHPDQYTNPANPQAHYDTTGPEIWRQSDGDIDALVVGVGTGGTISGAGRFLKEMKPSVQVVGADPEGSIYTAEDQGATHQYAVEGVGEDFYPETVDLDVIDRWVKVTDAESLAMTRRLARREGILVGGSCGMAAHAAVQIADEDHDALVVVILPDSGRGYLSKVFNDQWMTDRGFEI